jgi:drug/metabolite transporter (DMT)-like permease
VTLLGLLGVGGYNTFAYLALQTTTATNAVLLNSFIPVATMAIAWLVLGKRLSLPACLGVAVSLAGALTIVARGELAVLLNFNLNQGDLWMLLAITVWALYTIGLAWRPAGVDAMLLLAAFTAVGLAALLPAYLWEMAQGHSIRAHAGSLAALAYVGIFPSFIGYIFYNRGVAEVGASRASLFIHLMPVFGTLLSAIFLGEQPQHFHYVGISLIFIGIFLTMRKG